MTSFRESLFKLIDRVVVISIPSAIDRQDDMRRLLRGHSIPFEFHWGRDCTKSSVQQLTAEGHYSPAAREKLRRPSLTPAEIGCALSHRDLAINVATGNERVLVLEDDVTIAEGNLGRFSEAANRSPSWNLAYLGYQAMNLKPSLGVWLKLYTYYPISHALGNDRHNPATIRRIYRWNLDDHWSFAGWFNGAYAYAMDQNAAGWIARSQTPVSMEADLALNHLVRFSRLTCLCLNDAVLDPRWDIPSVIGKRPSWKD